MKIIIPFFVFILLIAKLEAMEPTVLINDLAMYKIGEGIPAILLPYPHASTYQSMSESKLVSILNELGYAVYTFDPPGIFNSGRKAEVTMEEFLHCTNELIQHFRLNESMLFVGHSQGGFCALNYTLKNPSKVRQLILIGTPSGWPIVLKASIHKKYPPFSKERIKMMYWGTRKMLGLSNLKIHKKLDQLVYNTSYVNKALVPDIVIKKGDHKLPDPVRAKWMVNLRRFNYDCSRQLSNINVPTLLLFGAHDPQTPPDMANELDKGIPNSTLVWFEKSGHSPFVEEPELFKAAIQEWLQKHSN